MFFLYLFKYYLSIFILWYSLCLFDIYLHLLSIFHIRAAMNDSGSGYQGATGMLDAEAEGGALCCNASNMSNVCTFFPLNLWFRHELKIPLGWGIIMDYWRSIGSYVLAFTNWIGFTRSFEAFEWHSYISVIMIFWKKIYICIYIYIYLHISCLFSDCWDCSDCWDWTHNSQ